jgi:hypothetical protein
MKIIAFLLSTILLFTLHSKGQDKQPKSRLVQDSLKLDSFANKLRAKIVTNELLAKRKTKDKPKTLKVFYNAKAILALAKND